MPKSVRMLIALGRYAYAIAAALGIPGWTYRFLHDVLAGMPLTEAMVLSLAGLVLTLWLGIAVAHGIEFWLNRSRWADEGNRVAGILEDLQMSGLAVIDAQQVVAIWYPDQPTNKPLRVAIKTAMYARLREAVRRGWIRSSNFPAHEVRQNFFMNLGDAIRFFRERRWLELE